MIELKILFKCLCFIDYHGLEVFRGGQVWDRLRLINAFNINFCLSGVVYYSAHFATDREHRDVDTLHLLYHLQCFDIFLWRVRWEWTDLELVESFLWHFFCRKWYPDHLVDVVRLLVLKNCLEDEIIELCVFCLNQANVVWRIDQAVPRYFHHEFIWLITFDTGEPVTNNFLMLALKLNVVELGNEKCVIVTIL